MADAIVIKIGLDASDIGQAQGKIRASVKSALDSALPDAKEIGKKIGNALADGMAEGIAKARQLRTQLDQILSPVARQRTNESAEQKHQQKLNEIRERGAQQQANIAAKAAAQEATIRAKAAADAERDARRFAEAQARIAGRGAPPDSIITFFKRYSSVIREAGESIQFAGGFFASIGGQIFNVGRSSIEAAGKVESIARAFKLLDKDKSGETLARLRKQADELSTSFIGYAEQVNRVRQTQKLTAEQSETLVKGLINVGRAAGVSREAQDRAVTALNQILAKGKVTAEELRGQLLEAIPNLAPIIEKRFGSLNAEVLEKKFGAKKFVAGLIEEFGKLQNLEPTGLEKFQVSLENLQIKLAPVGNKVLDFLNQNIEPLTRALESLINTFNSFTPATQEMIIKFGVLAIAIGPVIQGFGALVQLVGGMGNLIAVVAKLGLTSTATTASVSGLGAAILGLNPILLGVGVAIAAGTALWIGYGKTMGDIKDRFAVIEQSAARARGEVTLLDGTIQKASDQKFQLNQPADPRLKGLKVGGGQVVDFGNAVKVGPDGRPINPADNLAFNSAITGLKTGRIGGGGGGSESAESKARQLREAQLSQQKSFIEQNQRLLEDANKRELAAFKELYDQKEITARAFFDEKTRIEQASISASIAATQQEIVNAEITLSKTKPGTVERIRLESELFKLRTDLTIKSREFYAGEVDNIKATTKALLDQRKEALDTLKGFTVKLDESQLPSALIGGNAPLPIQQQAAQRLTDAAKAAVQFREKDLELQQQEIQIQNAIAAGVLTESQGKEATLAIQRQYRDVLIQSLEIQKAAIDPFNDGEAFQRINIQIEQLKTLGQSLSPTQSFFKGFRSEAETLAESFERIGKSFKDSVLGVVDSGIDKLTQKLGFFKSLVGDILKSLTRVLLGGLLQPRGGASGGGGIGGVLGSILGGSGGGLGGFATGGFAGGGGAASILGGGSGGGGILGTLANAIGGGISAPRSLSLGGLPIAGSIPFPTAAIPGAPGGGAGGGLSSLFGGLGGGLGNLFKGIGFGKAPGSGGALAGALPLLGLSLGSSLGTDRLTSILGGAAGGLLGVGLSAAPAALAAGGSLSSLGFLAPLFSNPLTAIAAGLALPAIFLLGRARQRKRDEKSSGDSLQDAVNQIKDIRKQVESNELTLNVSQARELFNSQILQPFIAQISQLKSKSVRESRLKNQTVDLRNLFEKEVIPAVQAQKAKQGINDKLIPEFAFGGIVPGRPTPGVDSVLARLSPGEMVLTSNHQAALQGIAGRNVFQAIGVPNSGESVGDGSTAFASGGFVGAASRQITTPTINMTVQLVVSGDEAVELLNAAASTDSGQQILVNARRLAQRSRLTR